MPITMPATSVPTTDPNPTPLTWTRPITVPSPMVRNRQRVGDSWRNAASGPIAPKRKADAVPDGRGAGPGRLQEKRSFFEARRQIERTGRPASSMSSEALATFRGRPPGRPGLSLDDLILRRAHDEVRGHAERILRVAPRPPDVVGPQLRGQERHARIARRPRRRDAQHAPHQVI